MIDGMFDGGAMPALQKLVQFTGARQQVLSNNIANLDTPYFKPHDLDPDAFEAQLQGAIDRRRHTTTPQQGKLKMDGPSLAGVAYNDDGSIDIDATTQNNRNILFHDRNNRDLERTMQDLAENTLAHNAGVRMLKNQFDMLRMAIRERP